MKRLGKNSLEAGGEGCEQSYGSSEFSWRYLNIQGEESRTYQDMGAQEEVALEHSLESRPLKPK